ncbi:MAG: flagellar assembly protein FliH [Proteobacteria bacterium]|nr:MAG: flagellar assembly protein FliH [Pseudomonadota bacterium]
MTISRVIPKEQMESILRWAAPEVDGAAGAAGARGTVAGHPEVMTAHKLEELQQRAYQEGFEQGRREGRDAGMAELRQQAQRLQGAFDLLSHPLEELDQAVEEQLLHLVTVVAQQMIRRELKANPGEIVAVVRECLALLPVASREVRVQLHPEDAALVRDALGQPGGERGWQIIEDPVITPGGCRVVTEMSRIDATVESRLIALVTSLLGGERQDDRSRDQE